MQEISPEVLETIRQIAKKLAPKYTFGYYDTEDIEQEAILIGCEGMSRYDPSRPLENFLYVHMNNRLKTFKRNKYFRLNSGGAEQIQQIKKNIMDPLSIEAINPHKDFDIFQHLELSEIRARIDLELPPYLRKDYLRICSGQKVSRNVKDKVIEALKEIFKGDVENVEEEEDGEV